MKVGGGSQRASLDTSRHTGEGREDGDGDGDEGNDDEWIDGVRYRLTNGRGDDG